MKLRYIQSAAVTALLLGAASCTDNDYTELNKGFDELTLSSTLPAGTPLELNEADHAREALSLNWTTGNNYGTGNAIRYTLELAEAGADFAHSYTAIADQTQVYSWTPSVEELNEILRSRFGAAGGETLNLEARVTASVAGADEVQTSVTTFDAVAYQPVTTTLYLIGDATPNGWSADNATEMQRTDNGHFSWTGNMTAGSFKFITTAGSFLPSYNNNGHGGLVLRTDDAQPDDQFSITQAGCYKVDVNLLDLTISVTESEGVTPAFDNLFFVGNETDWGFWPMSRDPLDPFLFRIGLFFTKGGEFKFGTSEGSWENMYKATQPNAPYTDTAMELVPGFDPDNKWFLTDAETNLAYKICVDIRTGAERMMMTLFTPYSEMYLVGDAAPCGWDLANATPMTQDPTDPNVFTWTGHLNTGELKFSADRQSDWNGAWFMATSENEAPTGQPQKTLFINKSDNNCQAQYKDIMTGGVDLKWRITEAGTYTVTLNQLYDEVTIALQ